jgi:hypothetical protein
MLQALHKQQQQQQQRKRSTKAQQTLLEEQRVAVSGVLDVAVNQLRLFSTLLSNWPANSTNSSSLSSSKELASAALPVMQLTMAVLEASGGKAAYVEVAVDFAAKLSQQLQIELQAGHASTAVPASAASDNASGNISSRDNIIISSSKQVASPAVLQLLHDEQLLPLLGSMQALYTQALRRSMPDSSSSSSRSTGFVSSSAAATGLTSAAAAAAAAESVLEAVGLSWTCSAPTLFRIPDIRKTAPKEKRWQMARFAAAVSSSAAVIQHLVACLPATPGAEAAASSSNSSSSSAVQATPHQKQQQELLARLLQPLALVQVELALLMPSVECKLSCLRTLLALLGAAECLGEDAHAALQQVLLAPVLQQLLPHVQGVLGAEGAAAAGGGSSSAACGGQADARSSCSSSVSSSTAGGGGSSAAAGGGDLEAPGAGSSGSSSIDVSNVAGSSDEAKGIADGSSSDSSDSSSISASAAGTVNSSSSVDLQSCMSTLLVKLSLGGKAVCQETASLQFHNLIESTRLHPHATNLSLSLSLICCHSHDLCKNSSKWVLQGPRSSMPDDPQQELCHALASKQQ